MRFVFIEFAPPNHPPPNPRFMDVVLSVDSGRRGPTPRWPSAITGHRQKKREKKTFLFCFVVVVVVVVVVVFMRRTRDSLVLHFLRVVDALQRPAVSVAFLFYFTALDSVL